MRVYRFSMSSFPLDRLRYYFILMGGFLGPFAGQSLSVVLPEFASDFDITLTQASLTMTAYTLPFAAMMLISSYLVRNLSPVAVVRVAYLIIAACSVVLMASPTWWVFLIAYVVAALCNAFTLPTLQLILRHSTSADQLGKALGSYAAMQSLGLLSAPLVAGATVSVTSWRWMYLVLLLFPLLIVVVGLPETPPPRVSTGHFRVTWPLVRGCLTLFAVGLSTIGMGFLIAIHVGDVFGLPPLTRGVIVMAGGLTALLLSRTIGGVADTRGPRVLIISALVIAACAVMGIGLIPSAVLIAVAWGVAVTAGQGVQVGINVLTLRSPSGPQILSTVQSFRFFGSALTPVLVLPLYGLAPAAGFGAAAFVLLASVALNSRAGD